MPYCHAVRLPLPLCMPQSICCSMAYSCLQLLTVASCRTVTTGCHRVFVAVCCTVLSCHEVASCCTVSTAIVDDTEYMLQHAVKLLLPACFTVASFCAVATKYMSCSSFILYSCRCHCGCHSSMLQYATWLLQCCAVLFVSHKLELWVPY